MKLFDVVLLVAAIVCLIACFIFSNGCTITDLDYPVLYIQE